MARRHPNELKLKKQRMKRAYLNSYNGIRVSRSVGKGHIPESSQALFDYRARGSTYWEDFFHKNQPLMLSKDRAECIRRARAATEGVSPECNVVVKRGGITKTIIRLYFSTDYSYCFLMKEDWRQMCMFKSSPFAGPGCVDRAKYMAANSLHQVLWVERIDFPTN